MIGIDLAFEEARISLDQLSEQTGLPRKRLEAIVTGRWLPSPVDRQLVAAALGRTTDEISWGHTMDPRNVRYHRFGLSEDF